MNITFAKMQGLGNDFVVIDAREKKFSLTAQQIQQMADRRTGIGFDQMLALESTTDDQADFVYRIFNADGGEVGQCGNGARCMALFIHKNDISDQEKIILKTKEALISVRMVSDTLVEVDMGQPKFAPVDIPFKVDQESDSYQLMIENQAITFYVVNVGNPHAVISVKDVTQVDLKALGNVLGSDAHFPEGVNVSVMQVLDPQHIRLRVFERGAGETQACGSAACAAVAAGKKSGLLSERVKVEQAGGGLDVSWQGLDHSLKMIGPAVIVYCGEWVE